MICTHSRTMFIKTKSSVRDSLVALQLLCHRFFSSFSAFVTDSLIVFQLCCFVVVVVFLTGKCFMLPLYKSIYYMNEMRMRKWEGQVSTNSKYGMTVQYFAEINLKHKVGQQCGYSSYYYNFHSSGKAFHWNLKCAFRDLHSFIHRSINEVVRCAAFQFILKVRSP